MDTADPSPVTPPGLPCANHPDVLTSQACEQCRRAFCDDCLVNIQGRRLCGECKAILVRGLQRRSGGGNQHASEAFVLALVGILICGPILQPLALYKALQARKAEAADPTLPGRWKTTAALIISSVVLLFYVVYFGLGAFLALAGR